MADEMIRQEEQRAGSLQQRPHDPEVGSVLYRIAIGQHVPDRDDDKEQTVQIRMNGRNRKRYAEDRGDLIAGEKQPGPYEEIVEAGYRRNRGESGSAHRSTGWSSPRYVIVSSE